MSGVISDMFTRISIRGYKSFRDRVSAALRPLTILAGANSSGKSSLIQPLLLFKQTLLTGSDPGPLRLDGPNVVFSRSEQMFWRSPGDEADEFEVAVGMRQGEADVEVAVVFRRRGESPGWPAIQIERTRWTLGRRTLTLAPKKKLSSGELEQIAAGLKLPEAKAEAVRQRCFLVAVVRSNGVEIGRFPTESARVEENLRRIIHVPGLRGNPERAYPVRAVRSDYPGLFQDYVASLVARWQRQQEEKKERLNDYLGKMGLTWKVRADRRSDTEVELQVGRTAHGLEGGAKDLVNIADVGFGLSQSLPVLVALIAAEPGQLVYLEQPEIHLHPEAQVALADLIGDAVRRGVQVVVETHSHLLLMAFQRSIAKKVLSTEQVVLHWFRRGEQGITDVESTAFNPDGSYEKRDIPVDFADVSMRLMREYLGAS
ncbi:MAG TPA: hypothetical protein ENK17_03350 [Anaerolineae bacterium]|nr:hypothetical protein [Anaerolineae bacterium]